MARRSPADQSQIRFGAYLRMLRQARSLSLRAASEQARAVATDSGGRLSGAYINLLEHGVPAAVSLSKLLSLAAVYNTGVEAMIAQLPEPLLSQRLADLDSWRAEGRPVPEPLRRVPGAHERTDAQLDELFAKRARGFAVPWGEWKSAVERAVREFLPYAVLPAFVEASPGLATDFWKLHPPPDRHTPGTAWSAARSSALAMVPLSPWAEIADTFVAWATRATDAIVSALRSVAWWNLDFTTSGASCHFTARDIDARYGFDAVPPGVVIAVRRWQLARFLSQHGAPVNWDPPDEPIEGARAFVEYLLRPGPRLPEYAPDRPAPAATIWGSLAALMERVPALQAAKTPENTAFVEAVASLLNRAADQPASSRSVKKTSRRRPST